MKTFIKKIFIFIFIIAWFLPGISFAAEIFFDSSKNNFSKNEEFLVQVFLDTDAVAINALEGVILFPDELLELKEIREGNSSVNFWMEKPNYSAIGEVSFSGITTGGFSGEKRFLFGMVFEAKDSGENSLIFSDIKILENNGLGSKVTVKEVPFTFSISEETNGSSENLKMEDIDPPEIFNPFVASDPTIFDGKYFLVWSTVDKGAGIDHYEVREGFWGEYDVVESPHLLSNQSLSSNIYVKAFDRFQNERLVKIKAQNPNILLELWPLLGIILVTCFFLFKKIWIKLAR
jgi:hypothetical protein